MNITDIENCHQDQLPTFNRLESIFHRQNELALKYHPIEDANGLLQTHDYPVNLHDAKGQARLKDFAWRTVEELAEALDALEKYQDKGISLHAQEELADSLHFLIEMALISGISSWDILEAVENPRGVETDLDDLEILWQSRSFTERPVGFASTKSGKVLDFIKQLGMTCHTLKNKPWKQSQMLTDVNEYRKRFIESFLSFIDICLSFKLSAQDMFDLYFKKSEVNKFRQRSKY